jgi:hypothetical protein
LYPSLARRPAWWSGPISFRCRVGPAERSPTTNYRETVGLASLDAPYSFIQTQRLIGPGVVVNKADGKYASAHDLRRAFGTRWAKRVMPAVLKRLMRHASIDTTMTYYVDIDVADELWAKFGPMYNNPYNKPPRVAEKTETARDDTSMETVENEGVI